MLIPMAELQFLADTMRSAGAWCKGLALAARSRSLRRTSLMLAVVVLRLHGAGGDAVFEAMDSLYGHDAFLKEIDWLGPRVKAHLEGGLEKELEAEQVHNTGTNAP